MFERTLETIPAAHKHVRTLPMPSSSTTKHLLLYLLTIPSKNFMLFSVLTTTCSRTVMASAKYSTPSSLLAPPVKALVSPGQCQFGDSLVSVPLLERTKVSPTSSVLRFGLPDKEKPLNLSTCACILANANIDGQDVTRPYTPISTNQQIGSFDLLVKDYGPEFGTMSPYLCSRINVGDQVAFKHISFNVKTQAPFDYDRICMLVGGTGKIYMYLLCDSSPLYSFECRPF